jgi:hypothetical protein
LRSAKLISRRELQQAERRLVDPRMIYMTRWLGFCIDPAMGSAR